MQLQLGFVLVRVCCFCSFCCCQEWYHFLLYCCIFVFFIFVFRFSLLKHILSPVKKLSWQQQMNIPQQNLPVIPSFFCLQFAVRDLKHHYFSCVNNWLDACRWSYRFHCARVAPCVQHIASIIVSRSATPKVHSLPSCVAWLQTWEQLNSALRIHWPHCRPPLQDWAQKRIVHVIRSWWPHWYRNRGSKNNRYVVSIYSNKSEV